MAACLAPAKINLCLHVVGRRADGYHLLDGLVAFAGFGDRVTVTPTGASQLTLDGPMAPAMPEPADNNLGMIAARRFAAAFDGPAVAIHLDKHIPVAAGLGGGAADAAAVLRLMAGRQNVALDTPALTALALDIGADVPVCLAGVPARMRGIGERLSPMGALPDIAVVLVNPIVAVASGAVFAAYAETPVRHDKEALAQAVAAAACAGDDPEAFIAALAATANHLTPAAESIAPAIADVLDVLEATDGCRLARMSGSGATCFGLFVDHATARAAAAAVNRRRPGWWVTATSLQRGPR